jgi:hypothetical protein
MGREVTGGACIVVDDPTLRDFVPVCALNALAAWPI